MSNNIYNIFQDSKGLLWFGTENGALLYDGTLFRLYTTSDGLPDNEIFNFCEDHKGRIWFSTFNGNVGYYFQGQFYNEKTDIHLFLANHPAYIYYMGVQYDSSVLLVYFQTHKIIEFKNNHFTETDLIDNWPSIEYITYVTKLSSNKYCVYSNLSKRVFQNSRRILIDSTTNCNINGNYNFTFGTKNEELFQINNCDSKFIRTLPKKETRVYTYFLDESKRIFEGSNEGLFIYPLNGLDSIIHILPDCQISSINKDREGNYWLGTLNKGVFFLPKDFDKVEYYHFGDMAKVVDFRLLNKNIYLFTEDSKIYLAQKDEPSNLLLDFKLNAYGSISSYFQIAVENNIILLGGNYNLKIKLNQNNTLSSSPLDTKPTYYKDIQIYNNSVYWHDNSELHFKKTLSDTGYISCRPIDHQRIFDIAENGSELWLSTNANLYKFESNELHAVPVADAKSFRKFNFYNGKLIGITHDYKLMVGNPLGGKNRFSWQCIAYNCVWLNMNYIFNNNVLLRSEKGYYILNIAGDSATIKPTENALLPNLPKEIICDSPFVYFLDADNGLTKVHCSSIISVPVPPQITVLSVKINEHFVDFTKIIEIEHEKNLNINIDFTGVGFNRKKINYQYSLNSQDWLNLDQARFNLLNPLPGSYSLRFRCCSDSSPFGNPYELNFNIKPEWFQTIWFKLLIFLLVLVIAGCSGRFMLNRNIAQREFKHKEELKFQHAEFKSLNALMNPHFIFNSLNNIQYLVNANNKILANEYLTIFSKLIRQNMENINQELISLEKEMDLVENYLHLEKLRFEDILRYTIQIDPDLDLSTIMVPPLLVQPLVENAIKHGLVGSENMPGLILIQISEENDEILVSIMNEFIPTHKEIKQKGLNQSLNNIKSRLQKLENIHGRTYHLDISYTTPTKESESWVNATIRINEV